ncbi:hypothetical protein GTW08_04680, partial [Pseudonocardia sp. SID8383]|nr:hypothetical protein [Pseudonocardia sp. SID8383]
MTSETRRTGGPDPSTRGHRGEEPAVARTRVAEESASERTQFVTPPGPDSPTTAV